MYVRIIHTSVFKVNNFLTIQKVLEIDFPLPTNSPLFFHFLCAFRRHSRKQEGLCVCHTHTTIQLFQKNGEARQKQLPVTGGFPLIRVILFITECNLPLFRPCSKTEKPRCLATAGHSANWFGKKRGRKEDSFGE